MTALSLRRFWPFGAKPTEPEPEPTLYEKARWCWNYKHTITALLAYLSLETDADKRRDAVELFMCRGVIDPMGEVGTNAPAVLEAFRLAEPQIRLLISERPDALDDGFVNNIEIYHAVRKHVEKYLPIGTDVEFELSIERIAAINVMFGEQLSKAAVESAVQFMLHLLGTLPVDDKHWVKQDERMELWRRALDVAKQLLRRTDEPLTTREIALALKAVAPRLALEAQRELLPKP